MEFSKSSLTHCKQSPTTGKDHPLETLHPKQKYKQKSTTTTNIPSAEKKKTNMQLYEGKVYCVVTILTDPPSQTKIPYFKAIQQSFC